MSGVLVHQMPHPVHAAWAEAAGLALHPWLPRTKPYLTIPGRDFAAGRRVPRGDVAVAEGGGPAGAVAFARTLRRVKRGVLLAADETWARIRRGVPEPLRATEAAWWRVIGRYLDGAIAVSPYVADDLRALFPRLAVRVVRPFVLDDVRARLLALDPPLATARVLHLASTVGKNGTPLLVEAFGAVRAKRPDAELHLVGVGSERWSGPGIYAHGRVPDLAPHLAAADLFALPGLGQACPVSTLEAMAAGVPTLVSEETGTKDLVAAADPGLVAPSTPDALADALLRYLDRAPPERRRLGAAARAAAEPFDRARQSAAFVAALRELALLPATA